MIPERVNNSLGAWLAYGTAVLAESGVSDAAADAWLLFEYVTGMSRSAYYLHMQDHMDRDEAVRYEDLLARRAGRIPLQYLTHEAWCFGNRFFVDSSVLIPRQDTEILIEEAVKRMRPGMRVLDLCTGSGCVLISVLKEVKGTGTGSDISEKALEVARRNADMHGIDALWVRSDLFDRISGRFDLILSNPPYIREETIRQLQPEVRDHEPRAALDGGRDGLDFYRRITEEAGGYLAEGGWLCVEIGYDQGRDVSDLFRRAGMRSIEVIKDYAGLDRVVTGQK